MGCERGGINSVDREKRLLRLLTTTDIHIHMMMMMMVMVEVIRIIRILLFIALHLLRGPCFSKSTNQV